MWFGARPEGETPEERLGRATSTLNAMTSNLLNLEAPGPRYTDGPAVTPRSIPSQPAGVFYGRQDRSRARPGSQRPCANPTKALPTPTQRKATQNTTQPITVNNLQGYAPDQPTPIQTPIQQGPWPQGRAKRSSLLYCMMARRRVGRPNTRS